MRMDNRVRTGSVMAEGCYVSGLIERHLLGRNVGQHAVARR